MTNKILTITMLTIMFLTSYKETPKQENTETTTTETVENMGDDIVTITSTDKDGIELELTFHNSKGTSALKFNGETIELVAQKSASGIWYKNDRYELRGKGKNVELTKDGKTVFSN